MGVQIKRIYDPPQADDGLRVLVDRLWPRGLKKSEARVDRWEKALAPSDELRRWFAHDATKWGEFRRRYLHELATHKADSDTLLEDVSHRQVTLLYAARDEAHNNARVLREYLKRRGG